MTPTDHKAVNAWMLANDWEWRVEFENIFDGHWVKYGMPPVPQELAAEMYRMSEGRYKVLSAREHMLYADVARAMGHMQGCGHPDNYLESKYPELAHQSKETE